MSEPIELNDIRVSVHVPESYPYDGTVSVRIELTHQATGIRFAVIDMSPTDFVTALRGGLGRARASLRVENLGKVRQTCRVRIGDGSNSRLRGATRDGMLDALIARYEVNGWRASPGSRSFNYHRQDDDGYSIVLWRWVDPETPIEPPPVRDNDRVSITEFSTPEDEA